MEITVTLSHQLQLLSISYVALTQRLVITIYNLTIETAIPLADTTLNPGMLLNLRLASSLPNMWGLTTHLWVVVS
jgi:hypothetical protein